LGKKVSFKKSLTFRDTQPRKGQMGENFRNWISREFGRGGSLNREVLNFKGKVLGKHFREEGLDHFFLFRGLGRKAKEGKEG